MNKLKDCPFCGSDDIEIEKDEKNSCYQTICQDCLARTICSCSKEHVAKQWNRRENSDEDFRWISNSG